MGEIEKKKIVEQIEILNDLLKNKVIDLEEYKKRRYNLNNIIL